MGLRLVERLHPAIDADENRSQPLLEAVDARIVERRDIAVLLRRKPFEPGLARVDPKRVGACGQHLVGKRVQRLLDVLLVDADAAFHGDRHCGGSLHGGDAVGDQIGRAHQAGAERPRLDAIRRAADIQVDLVIAEIGTDPRRYGELGRVGAAKLQRDGVLRPVEPEQPFTIAMDDGVGDDHLRIEQRIARQLAMKEPAMPVRPVHHGGDGKSVGRVSH